ncbi:hypothetical protein HRbin12_01337 [bacterium HR12]|nr:hypothetical protein HRbin12_01337 [bacterium HR12]
MYTAYSVTATLNSESKCRLTQRGSTPAPPSTGQAIAVSLIGGRSPPEPLTTTKYEPSGEMSPSVIRRTPPTRGRFSV